MPKGSAGHFVIAILSFGKGPKLWEALLKRKRDPGSKESTLINHIVREEQKSTTSHRIFNILSIRSDAVSIELGTASLYF